MDKIWISVDARWQLHELADEIENSGGMVAEYSWSYVVDRIRELAGPDPREESNDGRPD